MSTRELIIEAGRTEGQYWKDLWRYRELFYFLAWRDILVRYKQTAIGIAWALIRPLREFALIAFVLRPKIFCSSETECICVFSQILFRNTFLEKGESFGLKIYI